MSGEYLYSEKGEKNSKQRVVAGEKEKLKLHEEQIDISKKRHIIGEVTVWKEIVEDERNIRVPVTREELVIEKKKINDGRINNNDLRTETIRIPIREERIEVAKHTVVLENVEVYKQQLQRIERVEENLKKEKLHIKVIENGMVIDNKIEKNENNQEC